jgi:hypothetical protein
LLCFFRFIHIKSSHIVPFSGFTSPTFFSIYLSFSCSFRCSRIV